jgi:hypothetical protein
MKDIGGVALKTVIPKGGFDVDQFVDIACCICMYPLLSFPSSSLTICDG